MVSVAMYTKRRVLAAGAGAAGWGVLAACAGAEPGADGTRNAPARQPVTLRFKYRIPSDVVRQSYDRALEVWRGSTRRSSSSRRPTTRRRSPRRSPPSWPPGRRRTRRRPTGTRAWTGPATACCSPWTTCSRRARSARTSGSRGRWTTPAWGARRTACRSPATPPSSTTTATCSSARGSPLAEGRVVALARPGGARGAPHPARPGRPAAEPLGVAPLQRRLRRAGLGGVAERGTLTDVREAPARMTVDQLPAVEAISWLTDLSVKHRVGPTAAERRALGGDPFVLGKVAMLWGGLALFFNTMFQVTDFTSGPRPGPPRPGRHPGGGHADQRLRHLQGDEARRRGLHPDPLLHRRRRGQGAGGDSAGGGGPQADVAGGVDESAAGGEPAGPGR